VFTQLSEIPYLSHRFKLQKFLGLTEDEILENERMWKEENQGADAMSTSGDEAAGFGATGLKGPGESDLDLGTGMEDLEAEGGGTAEPGAEAEGGAVPPPPTPPAA
jgi:hypothetical protein